MDGHPFQLQLNAFHLIIQPAEVYLLLPLPVLPVERLKNRCIEEVLNDQVPSAAIFSVASPATVSDALALVGEVAQPSMHQGFPAKRAFEHLTIRVGRIPAAKPPHLHDLLCLLKNMPFNDGAVPVLHHKLRNSALRIPDLPVGEVVLNVGFLKDRIPCVLFILQHPAKLKAFPAISRRRFDLSCDHIVHDLRRSLAMHIPFKNLPHDFRLVLPDQEERILRMVKTVKRNLHFLPFFKPFPDAPLHVFGNAPALFLGERCHDGQKHLRNGICRVDILFFEIHLHACLLKLPDRCQGIHRVPGKPADALAEDVVDLPGLAVVDHRPELHSVLHGGSADPFISVDLHQFPSLILLDAEAEGLHLVVQALQLVFLVRAHPAIDSDPSSASQFPAFKLRNRHFLYPPQTPFRNSLSPPVRRL